MANRMIAPGVYEFNPDLPEGQADLEKHEKLWSWSHIPQNFKTTHQLSTFEEIEGRAEAFRACCEFIRGEVKPPLLLMWGKPGLSKTHLAVAVGQCFLAQLKPVVYYHVGDLLDDLRAGIRVERMLGPGEFDARTATAIMTRCKNSALLILDDLGVEAETDWACEKLDTIVNHRYENALPTLITANTLEVSDRIRDRCQQGRIVRLTGKSYREILAERRAAEKPARVRKGEVKK